MTSNQEGGGLTQRPDGGLTAEKCQHKITLSGKQRNRNTLKETGRDERHWLGQSRSLLNRYLSPKEQKYQKKYNNGSEELETFEPLRFKQKFISKESVFLGFH